MICLLQFPVSLVPGLQLEEEGVTVETSHSPVSCRTQLGTILLITCNQFLALEIDLTSSLSVVWLGWMTRHGKYLQSLVLCRPERAMPWEDTWWLQLERGRWLETWDWRPCWWFVMLLAPTCCSEIYFFLCSGQRVSSSGMCLKSNGGKIVIKYHKFLDRNSNCSEGRFKNVLKENFINRPLHSLHSICCWFLS